MQVGKVNTSDLHLAERLYPPRGVGWPSTASKPDETSTTSGANSFAIGMTTVLQRIGEGITRSVKDMAYGRPLVSIHGSWRPIAPAELEGNQCKCPFWPLPNVCLTSSATFPTTRTHSHLRKTHCANYY